MFILTGARDVVGESVVIYADRTGGADLARCWLSKMGTDAVSGKSIMELN